jgi:hypothetical protein
MLITHCAKDRSFIWTLMTTVDVPDEYLLVSLFISQVLSDVFAFVENILRLCAAQQMSLSDAH